MITAVEIENFKGIRERTRIEIKPITLLFGPNSAGKSTLMHALQLAREIFTRRNLDVDVTDGGAGFIDLGGFRNYVHGRDLTKTVTLRFDLDLSRTNFLTEYPIPETIITLPGPGTGQPDFDLSTIGDDIQTGWVEIKIGWRPAYDHAYIAEYTIGINGEEFAQIEAGEEDPDWVDLPILNIHHPLVRWPVEERGSFGVLDHLHPGIRSYMAQQFLTGEPIERTSLIPTPTDRILHRIRFDEGEGCWLLRRAERQSLSKFSGQRCDLILAARPDSSQVRLWGALFLKSEWTFEDAAEELAAIRVMEVIGKGDTLVNLRKDALPDLDRDLAFDLAENPESDTLESPSPDPARQYDGALKQILNRLLLVPGRVLRKTVDELRYVGPVRDAVPRTFAPPRFPDPRHWAGGLAAWEELSRYPRTLAPVVSEWLGAADKLNTGFRLEIREYRELTTDDELTRMLESPDDFTDMDTDEFKALLLDLLQAVPVKCQPRLVAIASGQSMHPADVGQGMTQAVPVIVAALHPFEHGERPRGGLVAIEQPELHLHPAAQIALGDLFIEATRKLPGQQLLIETHSEHLLLRLLRRIRQTTNGLLPATHADFKPEHLAVICFEPPAEGKPTRVYRLRIDDQGEFLDPWPRGFFDERAEELFGS